LRLPNPWSRLSPPGIQRALASPLTLPCSDPRPPPLTIAARSVCVRFSAHVAVLGSTLAFLRSVRPALASSPTLPCSNQPSHSVHITMSGLRLPPRARCRARFGLRTPFTPQRSVCSRLFAHVAVLESASTSGSPWNARSALASSLTLPCSIRPTHPVRCAMLGTLLPPRSRRRARIGLRIPLTVSARYALASSLTLPCSIRPQHPAHCAVLGTLLPPRSRCRARFGLNIPLTVRCSVRSCLLAHVAVLDSALTSRSLCGARFALTSSPTLPCSSPCSHSAHLAECSVCVCLLAHVAVLDSAFAPRSLRGSSV